MSPKIFQHKHYNRKSCHWPALQQTSFLAQSTEEKLYHKTVFKQSGHTTPENLSFSNPCGKTSLLVFIASRRLENPEQVRAKNTKGFF